MVERKFKDAGLVTDLQPLGMRSMAELLDTITRHGVLYAAVVTLQHEVHRSITINILHGTPQGKIILYEMQTSVASEYWIGVYKETVDSKTVGNLVQGVVDSGNH